MPEFKADTDGFMKKPSGFKMKGWSAFTKKTDPPMKMTVKLAPHNKNTPGVRPALMKIDDKKSPHEQYIALKNKIDNKTASKGDIRKFKRLQKAMGEGVGHGNYDEID